MTTNTNTSRPLVVPCRAVAAVNKQQKSKQGAAVLGKLPGSLPWLGIFGRADLFTLCEWSRSGWKVVGGWHWGYHLMG